MNIEKYIAFISGGCKISPSSAEYIFENSLHCIDGAPVFMVRHHDGIRLIAPSHLGFLGESFNCVGKLWTLAPLSHTNACRLRELFPFTRPSPVLKKNCSIGLGDRLGLATPGHIKALVTYPEVYPVFAQQSIRELTLTGRTFENVIDCASFAVFREGFHRPFGADGDHLKTFEEIEYAISAGCTMITLDCSEHIHVEAAEMTEAELEACPGLNKELEEEYLGRETGISGFEPCMSRPEFLRCVKLYSEAINFAEQVYHRFFADCQTVELELSIDETSTATSPFQHFYVARELEKRGVRISSLAPRFCGEFQKGVEYRGDTETFECEFIAHQAIAKHFGYKISVHSGSDKFRIFPVVASHAEGRFHLKTAGTNWLEAMALVAEEDPALYREIHAFALENFSEAAKYYHVTTDLSRIPFLTSLLDDDLPALFGQEDLRQLIHITYGLILSAENPDGSLRFYDRLYSLWYRKDREYANRLKEHIGRHLRFLCP